MLITHASHKIRKVIIPCAGKANRMGKIDLPKSLYPIKGKPALVHLLFTLNKHFDYFYIPISDKKDEEEKYREFIPPELLEKITFIPSLSGGGDGQAVLDALNKIEVHEDNYLMVCWGDTFIPDSFSLNDLLKVIKDENEDLLIPTTQIKNPYVCYFKNENNFLTSVEFSKEGYIYDEGLTDMSIFFIKSKSIKENLTKLKQFNQKGTSLVELNFLHLVEFLYNSGTPAKTFCFSQGRKIKSFNSISEADDISLEGNNI